MARTWLKQQSLWRHVEASWHTLQGRPVCQPSKEKFDSIFFKTTKTNEMMVLQFLWQAMQNKTHIKKAHRRWYVWKLSWAQVFYGIMWICLANTISNVYLHILKPFYIINKYVCMYEHTKLEPIDFTKCRGGWLGLCMILILKRSKKVLATFYYEN